MNTTLPPADRHPSTSRYAWRDEPASSAQLSYLQALIARRHCDKLGAVPDRPTKGQLSDAIEWCKRQPARTVPNGRTAPISVPDGLYAYRDQIVRIRRAVHTTGRQYAQRWNPVLRQWDTPRGLLRTIQLDSATCIPLPSATASAFGKLYGKCINCMQTLTDDTSIAHGYGPVCAANNGWDY